MSRSGALVQGSAERRRPCRPRSLSPPFTSLKLSRTSQFSSFVLSEQISWIKTRSLTTVTISLEIQDGEDVDVLWRPGGDPKFRGLFRVLIPRNLENAPLYSKGLTVKPSSTVDLDFDQCATATHTFISNKLCAYFARIQNLFVAHTCFYFEKRSKFDYRMGHLPIVKRD